MNTLTLNHITLNSKLFCFNLQSATVARIYSRGLPKPGAVVFARLSSLSFISLFWGPPCRALSSLAKVLRCTSSGPSTNLKVLAAAHIAARGWSLESPPPPCICIARSRQTCVARGTLILHTARASITLLSIFFPKCPFSCWSSLLAASNTDSFAVLDSTRAMASFSSFPPKSRRLRPNALRSEPRWTVSNKARSQWPIRREQWCKRPGPSLFHSQNRQG